MKQYLDLLDNIMENGVEKESGRENMPNTIGISKGDISMDLSKGFPLLTTKKMFLTGIIHELRWFLRGETNIKYLVDNKVNIWNGDAYRWYMKHFNENTDGTVTPMTQEEFIETIKNGNEKILNSPFGWFQNSDYKLGDLGKVYGYQWRNQNGVDQVKDVLDGLKNTPYSRYHIIDAWNKADFRDMALPPCHLLYQFIVRPLSLEERREIWNERVKGLHFCLTWYGDKTEHNALDEQNVPKFYLDLNMYQRSCDTFLGVPFNIASMSLLLMLFAKINNMIPGIANWIGGDTHLYVDHIPMVNEQTSRQPFALPKLLINPNINTFEDILAMTINDFQLTDYVYHPQIKAELFTGNKKV